jgi:DNA-binding transcriptional LysR family regulator
MGQVISGDPEIDPTARRVTGCGVPHQRLSALCPLIYPGRRKTKGPGALPPRPGPAERWLSIMHLLPVTLRPMQAKAYARRDLLASMQTETPRSHPRPTLSWEDFRVVKAIADARSLGGAAQALALNHSTVFRRLQSIEHQLGSRLFERNRGAYVLTPCGEEMVRLAERMGEEIVTFERQAAGHDLRPAGDLRVTTNDTLLVHLLPAVLAAFRRAYPEIVLDLMVSNQAFNLSKRDADVALRATDAPPETLVGRRICAIAWAIFGAQDRAFEGDERQFDWVGFGDNLAGLKAAKWLADHVAPERVVYKINTVLGLAEAAAAGIGLVLLPCFIGANTPGLRRLSAVKPELENGLWLLTHPDLRQTARVRAFMDFAAAEIAQRRPMLEGRA